MPESPRIADQLLRSVYGPAWHGPALKEILANVEPDQAARRPILGAHTIWELVSHITAWQEAVRAWLTGELGSLPELDKIPDVDWPPTPAPPTPEAWKDAVTAAKRACKNLVKAVQNLDDARLDEIVAGREYNVYFLLHGVVQHNLYHAGQIAILKKA